jgi:predicted AAA+ superfamily ATPase
LEIVSGVPIEPGHTLVIIDEIQDIPSAVTSLKYLYEEHPDIHIATAGSLLGVALQRDGSFPVGKVQFLDLHPLDFNEFLRALGDDHLATAVANADWKVVEAFRGRLLEHLKSYMFLGGMPEVVERFIRGESFEEARQVQLEIAAGYESDFAKYADAATAQRISRIWRSIPSQLGRENKKFLYGLVRDGARAREFETAIQWLIGAGLVHKVARFTKPGNPVRSYKDPHIFKLYLHDVGVLGALSALQSHVIVDDAGVFEEFKGSLTEQYVLQQIIALGNEVPMYWTPQKPTAEVDFAIEQNGALVPIEVKAAENLKSKSLRSYINRFAPEQAYRFSLANYRVQDDFTNIPLYGINGVLRQTRS